MATGGSPPPATLSSSESDTHLFTTAPVLLTLLLSSEADFAKYAESWAISYRTFIPRDSLLRHLQEILTPPVKLRVSDPDTQARLVRFLSWWIQYYPKDFGISVFPRETVAVLRR